MLSYTQLSLLYTAHVLGYQGFQPQQNYPPQNKVNPVQFARPYVPGRTPPAPYRPVQQPQNYPPQSLPVIQGQPIPGYQQPAMFPPQQQPAFPPPQQPRPDYGTVPNQRPVSRLYLYVCVYLFVCMCV